MTHFCTDGDDCKLFDVDPLIIAITDLDVAVDNYTHGVFVNATNPDPEDVPVSVLRAAVVEASTAVAAAMTDADVSLVDVDAATSVIPVEIRAQAADAEVAMLRGSAKLLKESRCDRCAGTGQFITYVENGVPKGPGGICYRCGGKGVQTLGDRRRNYGHDNFAPISLY